MEYPITNTHSTGLFPDEQRQFEENGDFFPVRVLDDSEAKQFDRYLEFHQTGHARIEKRLSKGRRWMHEIIRWPAIVDVPVWNTACCAKMSEPDHCGHLELQPRPTEFQFVTLVREGVATSSQICHILCRNNLR